MNNIKESIGYCDYSWNPITGCLNHTNGFCKGGGFRCYAHRVSHGRTKHLYLKNENVAESESTSFFVPYPDPFYPRFWADRLKEPLKLKNPSRIFVCDMSDWCGSRIPEWWSTAIIEIIEQCPQHTFLLLTKQPQNLVKRSPFPDNCEVGVTITNMDTAIDVLPFLAQVEAKTTFVSYEPLLDKVPCHHILNLIDWLVIGACTGSKKDLLELKEKYSSLTLMPWGKKWTLQPQVEWVQTIVEAADNAGVLVFQKDNLQPLLGNNLRRELPAGEME